MLHSRLVPVFFGGESELVPFPQRHFDLYMSKRTLMSYERIHEYVVDGVVVLLGNKNDLEKDRQVCDELLWW